MSDLLERLRKQVQKPQHEWLWLCFEAATYIERLTKERDEARLQDPNQWRREYWKHYNDLKDRADSLAAELAKVREAAQKQGVIDGNQITSLAAELTKAQHEVIQLVSKRDDNLALAGRWKDRAEAAEAELTKENHDRDDTIGTVHLLHEQLRLQNDELAKAREALERAGIALDMAAGFAERGQYPVSAFEYRKAASDARAALPATQTLDQYEAKLKKWEQENREATLSHVIAGIKCQCDLPVVRCDDKGCYCIMCGKLA